MTNYGVRHKTSGLAESRFYTIPKTLEIMVT
jgi:hypothetical protein